MKTVGSPKAPSASRMQVSTASRRSSRRVVDAAHAAAAAAGDRLHEQRVGHVRGRRDQRVGVGRRARPRPASGTPAALAAAIARALLPVRVSTSAVGPMKVMPGVGAGLGERGVLREEAVAGVDRVRAGADRRGDDHVGVEVGPHRVAALADLVGLVGLQPVLGAAVLVGEDRDRLRAELVGGAERPDRDLAAVGHQHLGEHALEASGSPRTAPRSFAQRNPMIAAGRLGGVARSGRRPGSGGSRTSWQR